MLSAIRISSSQMCILLNAFFLKLFIHFVICNEGGFLYIAIINNLLKHNY